MKEASMFHEATMHIAAVCVTYLRPRQLGWMIYCFLRQDYPAMQRELVILDDAGQYGDQSGARGGWFRSPSVFPPWAKNATPRPPWWASGAERPGRLGRRRSVPALGPVGLGRRVGRGRLVAAFAGPALPQATALHQHQTGGLFHGGWAYRRELFRRSGGYPPVDNGEDQALAGQLAGTGRPRRPIPARWAFRPFTSTVGAAYAGTCRAWAPKVTSYWAAWRARKAICPSAIRRSSTWRGRRLRRNPSARF